MGEFLSSGAKNRLSGQVGVMYVGQILIDAFCQCEVALSDAVGIVTGQSDLHSVVDVVPVGMMVLLLSTVRHMAHELPSSLEVSKLKISGQPNVFQSPAWMGDQSFLDVISRQCTHAVFLLRTTPDSK